MAIITAKELVEFCERAARERWGYVYSAQGEVYTEALAQKWALEKRAGKSADYYLKTCARNFSKRVVDCSGLIVEAFRSKAPTYGDRTANTFFAQATVRKEIGALNLKELGQLVHRKGHVGVHVGGGEVVEAAGVQLGVVRTLLSAPGSSKPWTGYAYLKDVDYMDNSAKAALRLLKLASPYMRGADVRAAQAALLDAGYSPGAVDGIFGPKTRAAVMGFQKRRRLAADGIVGPLTWAALGGEVK